MRVAVEVTYDEETRQWCMGMVSPPWIASCARTRSEARKMFLEAFKAYFDVPRPHGRGKGSRSRAIELVTIA